MPAYNLHRKILELPSNSTDMCLLCDPLQNQTVNCIPICSDLCPFNCNTTDSYLPQPPPSTGGYFINTTPQQNHHHSPLSLPLKISLVILALTFSFFLLYTLYKFYTIWYRSRRRGGGLQPPQPEPEETRDEFVDHDVLDHPIWYIRTIGLQPSVISAITVVKYNKSEGLIDGASCSVCLSDFQEDETLRLLPKCNHAFHISCIDTWLRSHTNCPLCRAGIVKSVSNLDDLGQIEDTQVAISITEDENGGQSQREDVNQSSEFTISVVDDENKQEIGGGSAIIRRSVSLDDYAAFRVRSDILNNNNNNNYYSDRHDVQIQPVDGDLRFELIKVDRTVNNRSVEP